MRLSSEVVDLVGLCLLHDPDQVGAVAQVAVVQHEAPVVDLRVLVEVVDPLRVEERSAAFDAVDHVPLLEQKLCEIRSVLPGNSGDQCHFSVLVHRAPAAVSAPDSTPMHQ